MAKGELTVLARYGAFLDARGYSITDIGERLNVHPGTVTNWRARDDYVALRAEHLAETEGKLEAIITHARLEMLDLHRKTGTVYANALAGLQEAIDAVLPDSTEPNWAVRIEAYKIIQKMLAAPSPLIAKAIAAAEELNGAPPVGPAVVQLQITVANATDEVEGEVVDGDWQANQDGDGDPDQAALDAGDDTDAGEGAGASDPVECTCANPTAWLEATCPLHGDEVRERLAQQGLDVDE